MSGVLDIFRFRQKNTFLHSLDPRAKFTILLALSAASLALSDPFSLSVLLSVEIILLKIAKSLSEWVKSLRGLASMVVLIFILNYLTLPFSKLYVSVAMSLRFLSLATAFSVFFLTTTPDEVSTALEVSGVPREYTMMFTMSLRFVPSLARDLQTVSDALRSRGLELDRGGLKERLRNYTYLLVPLIVYELKRSLMVAEALEARGFGAIKKVEPFYELRLRIRDYFVLTLSCCAVLMVVILHLTGIYSCFTSKLTGVIP
ncbi:MAG: energy-coupling factor transporter transmembrane component T [Thermofilaceae archaeon]